VRLALCNTVILRAVPEGSLFVVAGILSENERGALKD